MQRAAAVPQGPALGRSLLLAMLALPVTSSILPTGITSDPTWSGLAVGGVLVAVTLPALRRQAAREGDNRLYWLLVAALVLKLVGAFARLYVADDVYGGVADATGYFRRAEEVASRFLAGNYDTGLEFRLGGDWVVLVCGIVLAMVGPTKLGAFVFFSWLGFWGIFLIYRAFTIAVPQGRNRTYARLLFFLPSMLFWPSSIGKEALMTFALGIAALGAARLVSGWLWRGLAGVVVGLWLAALVRPHVAGIMAVALAAAFLLRPARDKRGRFAPMAKITGLIGLAVISVLLVQRTDTFLEDRGIETDRGVKTALSDTVERTDRGGSVYTPSVAESPARAPIAVATVLFRPLLHEAHNTQARLAAAEGTFLLILSLVRWRWMIAAFRRMRSQAYLGFALVYTVLFTLAFSSFSNFGILTRERVQVLPFYFVLLGVPSAAKALKQSRQRPLLAHGPDRELSSRVPSPAPAWSVR